MHLFRMLTSPRTILAAAIVLDVVGIAHARNYALQLDGQEAYVACDVGAVQNLPEGNAPRTAETWFKMTEVPTGLVTLMGYGNNCLNQALSLLVGDGRVAISQWGQALSLKASVVDGRWHHIAVVHDGAGAQTVYVDGKAQKPRGSWTLDTVANCCKIGCRLDGRAEFFPGVVDETRIWNVARTEEEIHDGAFRTLTGHESGLVGYWKFDEGRGTKVADATGNNGGVLVNDPRWVSSDIPTVFQEERWIHPCCKTLPTGRSGTFIALDDGSLMTVEGSAVRQSEDDGRTWSEPHPIYSGPGPGRPSGNRLLLKTHNGAIVYVYMDLESRTWSWDSARRAAAADVRLDVWSIRSLDRGKTWIDRQRIFEGYCGALIDIIQTTSGHIVVPVQRLIDNPSRHGTCTYVSADDGKTWQCSNIIDLGGHGHHDGAMEATLVELEDSRLWMLLRTNWDRFWEAYSTDAGLSWRVIQPSDIDASSAPGYLTRLASGRLALVWNRLYPQERTEYLRRNGDGNLCQAKASWHREELSIAFSENDGATWTEPIVIASDTEGLSYPYLFERRPGELWITTRFQGALGVSLREADLAGR